MGDLFYDMCLLSLCSHLVQGYLVVRDLHRCGADLHPFSLKIIVQSHVVIFLDQFLSVIANCNSFQLLNCQYILILAIFMCKYFKEIVILHNYNDICQAALYDSVQKLVFIFVIQVGNVIHNPRREQSLLIRDKEIFVSFLDVGNLILFLPIFFVEFHFFVDCF